MENYGVSKAALATYYKVNKKLETLVFIVYINNNSNYAIVNPPHLIDLLKLRKI